MEQCPVDLCACVSVCTITIEDCKQEPPYAFILVTSYRHDTLSDDRSVPMCNYTLKLGMPGTAERLGSKEKVMLNTRNIGCQTETRTPILAHFANVDAVRIDVWVSDLVLESDPRR
jgi:hypothetical protein